jgi:hypothetical protein
VPVRGGPLLHRPYHALNAYPFRRWFDRARGNRDHHGVHFLTANVAGV